MSLRDLIQSLIKKNKIKKKFKICVDESLIKKINLLKIKLKRCIVNLLKYFLSLVLIVTLIHDT